MAHRPRDRAARPGREYLHDHVATVRHGWFAGARQRGRMPWFQSSSPDPDVAREVGLFRGLAVGGGVACDIGAHAGPHTWVLAGRVGPSGRVISFDPDPESFRKLTDLGYARRHLETGARDLVPADAERVSEGHIIGEPAGR